MKDIKNTKNDTCTECGQNVHECQCPMAKTPKKVKNEKKKN